MMYHSSIAYGSIYATRLKVKQACAAHTAKRHSCSLLVPVGPQLLKVPGRCHQEHGMKVGAGHEAPRPRPIKVCSNNGSSSGNTGAHGTHKFTRRTACHNNELSRDQEAATTISNKSSSQLQQMPSPRDTTTTTTYMACTYAYALKPYLLVRPGPWLGSCLRMLLLCPDLSLSAPDPPQTSCMPSTWKSEAQCDRNRDSKTPTLNSHANTASWVTSQEQQQMGY